MLPKYRKELSSEEDYRDFEERDLSEGWPYPDKENSGTESQNREYGDRSGPDGDGNSGFRVNGVDADGNEFGVRDSLQAGSIDRDESDELEARVTEILENIPDVDIHSIDVHVDGHTVTLEGTVETLEIARKVELAALAIDGVRQVHNKMGTTGVDSHIPDED